MRVPGPGEQMESGRKFYTSTPGHNAFLINHETEDMHQTLPGRGQTAFEVNLSHHALVGHIFTTDDGAGGLKLWHFKPVGPVDVPYWDVAVDPAIIKDHGDIWNPRARAMMAAVFRMNIQGKMAATKHPVAAPTNKAEPAAIPPKPDLQREPDFQRLAVPQTR